MAAPQSWSAWLWDTYSSITSSINTSSSQNDNTSQSPSSSSSPYGPYVRTGRGGAGNFTWQSQQTVSHSEENLEAQNPSNISERQKAAADVEHFDTDAALKTQAARKPATQYVRVGRGFIQSDELQPFPQSVSDRTSILPTITSNPNVAHPGRGGAGNYAAATELTQNVENEKRKQEALAAEDRRQKVEHEIQNTLLTPPDAYTRGRRRSLDLPASDV